MDKAIIYYTIEYKEEVLEYIKHIPYYLTKIYGDRMKNEFRGEIQQLLQKNMEWNRRKSYFRGRPEFNERNKIIQIIGIICIQQIYWIWNE